MRLARHDTASHHSNAYANLNTFLYDMPCTDVGDLVSESLLLRNLNHQSAKGLP